MLRTALLLPRSLSVQDHVLSVHSAMQDVLIDTGNVNMFISGIMNLIATQTEIAAAISVNISSIHHVLTNLSNTLYHEANLDLLRAQTHLQTLLQLSAKQQNFTSILHSKYITLDISDLILRLSDLHGMVGELDNLCEAISTASSGLAYNTESIIDFTSLANGFLSAYEVTIARAQMLLFLARDDIKALTQIIGRLQIGIGGSGSGEISSGSGINSDGFLTVFPSNIASIATGISNLTTTTEQLTLLLLLHNATIHTMADISPLLQVAHIFNR